MKKSIAKFTLMVVSIICLLSIAVFGIRAISIPGVFDEDGIRLGLDLAGGSAILYEADINRTPSASELNTAVAMIRERLTMLNYTEATVAPSGANQIRVEIPGISDPEEAVKMLGANAVLEFKDADGILVLDGKDVVNASADYGNLGNGFNEWFISLKLNNAAVAKWAEATRNASRRSEGENYIAIFMDDAELSFRLMNHSLNPFPRLP